MPNTFLISDTHFSHANILNFKESDGSPCRDFSSVQEMDETMVDNWNRVVKPEDKVYHLGDVCFKNAHLEILSRLNGTKVLIKGNHDNLKPAQYLKYFKDIRSYWVLDKFVLSHIPLHTASVLRWKANIHGHLHNDVITYNSGYTVDSRYINVCVERINYTPVSFDSIRGGI